MSFVLDAAGSMDGNLFVEGSSFDDILMDLADQLNDTSTGEFLNTQQTRSHTHWFSGPLSRTTGMSRYQKGKTNLDFTEASKRQRVAVASAGPYASLQLAPDR